MNEQLIPVCMRAGPSRTAPPGALAIVVRIHAGRSTGVEPASRIGVRDELLHYLEALKAA